ncbi:histidine kinase [Actinoplanes sp. NPDC049802]|uniref:sensor histidine kinase n=1 Tax=Actinoplanes sp. NPDC049802 TaxID=3154742 RepID=UPI0033EE19F2
MAGWRLRGRSADAVLVAAVALIGVTGLLVQSRGIGTVAEWAALAAVLISAFGLIFRRRSPVAVGVVALGAVAAYGFLLQQPGPIMLVFVVALYTVVDEGHLAMAIGLGAASVLAFAAADSYTRDGISGNGATFLHAGWLVAVIVGVTRNRRAYLSAVAAHDRAAGERAEEQARRRAADERLRIARELHDILGHHLSLINVQAGAALHRPDPQRSEQALTTIKETSRETLRELRATLSALRQDGAAPLAPPPGLNSLDVLVAAAAGSGLRIDLDVTETRPLPPDVDLAAYRIVQEAITNVTRHAAAAQAIVRIRPDGDDVLVEVDDDGSGVPGASGDGISGVPGASGNGISGVPGASGNGISGVPGGSGNGILGMEERARALGGRLATGPRPGGGFRVSARIPLSPDRVPS